MGILPVITKILDISKRLRRGPVVILLGAILVSGILIATRPQSAPVQLPERAWSVAVMPARAETIQPTLELYGRVESPEDAELTAAVEADVIRVLVKDGDSVAAGTQLLILDDQDARLELLQREADVQEIDVQIRLEQRRLVRNREALDKERELLELAEKNEERVRSLYDDKLVSLANVDDSTEELKRQQLSVTSRVLAIEESELRIGQLRAQLTRAQALREKSQLTVDRTRIAAPFAGTISEVEISVGDRVRVGDSLMRLHNPDSLELRTQIPTRFANRIRAALNRSETLGASIDTGGGNYVATLERISGQTRQGSGSVDAFLRFDQAPRSTQLGATVQVLLSLPAEGDAIAVPAEAIYGRNRIYTVQGERMMSLDVERLGERTLGSGTSEIIIRSPELTAEDLIITTKVSTAADGLLVAVRETDAGDGGSPLLASREAE